MPEFQSTDFEWPDRNTAEKLIRRYFEFGSPTYRILHRPRVEAILHDLYQRGEITERDLVPPASKAILLLVLAMATMFQVDD